MKTPIVNPAQPRRRKWPGRLSDRERFRNQMSGQSVDRCFNMEFGYWKENFQAWRMFRENGISNNSQAHDFFGFDRIENVTGTVFMHPPFPETVISGGNGRRLVMNRDGLTAEIREDGHSSIPRFVGSSITCPEDWLRVKAERFRRDDPARVPEIEALKAAHPPSRDYPLGIFCGSMIGRIRDMLTFEGLAYAVADHPEMVEDMVETCCLLVEDQLDRVLPHLDFDFASGWEDICFKNGPLVSPSFFEAVVVPRYRRIARKLHQAGIELWYTDCDGDVRPLVPHFLAGGINCLFPFEVNGAGHPGELLDLYGGRLKIMGGVDKTRLIAGRAETARYLESLARLVPRGGFIPFCDHRCPPDVSEDNYLHYLDLKQSLFGSGG